jgi:ribose transport system substrate-binding protein
MVVVTACGGGSSGSTSASGGSASGGDDVAAAKAELAKYTDAVTSYQEIPALSAPASLQGKNVWYVPIGSAVPILSAFGTGIQQALDKVGATTHTCDGKFVPTSIASCLDQAVSQKADAVITGYIDYQLVSSSFDKLVAAGIPVLIAGEAPSGGKTSGTDLAFYDTTPTIQIAQQLQMDAVISDSGGKANVLYVGVTDSPQLKDSADFAVKYLKDHCSGCSITRIDYNTASLNKVASQVSSALISNPDVNYVVDEVDAAGQNTVAGIQSAGFTNKVKLASSNGDLAGLQRIQSGQAPVQIVDAGVSPIYLGWLFADGIVRMLGGEKPQELKGVVRAFTKDNVGSLDLTPESYATIDWYGNDSYQKTFLTAWGVS